MPDWEDNYRASFATDGFVLSRTNMPVDGYTASKTTAFDGTAGNGAVGSVSLFTVTGTVLVRIFGTCSETLVSAGGGTITVGTASSTAGIFSSITATAIASGDVVITGAAPAQVGALGGNFGVNGANIIATVGTGNITDGTITWYCLWRPLSTDGNVVAA